MKNIDRILWQSFQGKLSPEARQQLEEWLQQSEENKQFYFQLQKQWNKRTPEPVIENQQRKYEKILMAGKTESSESKRIGFSSFLKIAAGLAIVFLTAFGVWQITKNQPVQEVAEIEWINKENQSGQKSRIILPDGSLVWLNAESSLYYPASFSDSARTLKLEGEAYFQVAKDTQRPFIVQSGAFQTMALGTEFNVNAYTDNEKIKINLVEGKIKVFPVANEEGFILVPGEGLDCSNTDLTMKKYQFDTHEVEWKDGVLTFKKDNFKKVVKELKRWYGVEIVVEGAPPQNWQLNGRFENAYLTEVLESMQYNRQFSYELNGKNLQIKF